MSTKHASPASPEDTLPSDEKSAPPCWSPLGTHRYYSENDLLVIDLHGGEFSLADMQLLAKIVTTIQDRYGYYLLLANTSRGVTIIAEVRRWVVDWAKKYGPKPAMACIGAGLVTRAAVTLAIHALRLVSKFSYPTAFFAEMEEGRNWLLNQRAEMAERWRPR